MSHTSTITLLVFAADLLIRLGLSVRVIMRCRPVGVSLAWLTVILSFPIVGAVIYLLFGELRLGRRRAARAARIHGIYQRWLADLRQRARSAPAVLLPECQPLARLAESAMGIPEVPGNALELLVDAESVFRSLISDIDRAQRTCHLEFYIWNAGGLADEVAAALKRAVARGVVCRVLLDDVGSRPFLRHHMRDLVEAGIHVHAALPAGLLRMLFVRFDLRMHRKIVVIDGEIAYTGSLNLVDPRYFKQDAGVGQWVDAMVRVRGPAVEALGVTFLEDWELETGEGVEELASTADVRALPQAGDAAVQVLPSGPAVRARSIEEVLLMAIYAARRELVLTTPYFVPDDPLVTALVSAAHRGVNVRLIVPERVDSLLVRLAGQAHRGELVEAGVDVLEFRSGLLHTKSVTIDGELSLFGSLNLDPRSLFLNFEITLGVYDREFTRRLRALQEQYVAQCVPLDLAAWRARPPLRRFVANVGRLLSPLL